MKIPFKGEFDTGTGQMVVGIADDGTRWPVGAGVWVKYGGGLTYLVFGRDGHQPKVKFWKEVEHERDSYH